MKGAFACLDPILSFRYTRARPAEVAEQADARDSNSRSLGIVGSTPTFGIDITQPIQQDRFLLIIGHPVLNGLYLTTTSICPLPEMFNE